MRQIVGGRAIDHTAASTSQVGRFETEILTLPDNVNALKRMSGARHGLFGDLEGCLLREGIVHGAKDWKSVLDPIVVRYRDRELRRSSAVKWTRLSCHAFADDQVRLQLFALAHNLGNFFRQVALPKSVRHWTMTTLREKVPCLLPFSGG